MSTTSLAATTTHAGIRERIIGGAVAGMIAGVVFAMFEMIAAAALNGANAFFMPLRMIGAIALGPSALDPAGSLLTAGVAGLVVHMALSMMYGAAVAVAISVVPSIARSTAATVAAASVAGFALWIGNFYILAGVFGWTWFPDTQNVAVQFVAHTFMFGSVLGILAGRLARLNVR